MNFILKYNLETYELLGIISAEDEKRRGYIKEENIIYIPCKDKIDAIKTYRSVLRERINYLKKEKRKINNELIELKNKLQEIEKNEK